MLKLSLLLVPVTGFHTQSEPAHHKRCEQRGHNKNRTRVVTGELGQALWQRHSFTHSAPFLFQS